MNFSPNPKSQSPYSDKSPSASRTKSNTPKGSSSSRIEILGTPTDKSSRRKYSHGSKPSPHAKEFGLTPEKNEDNEKKAFLEDLSSNLDAIDSPELMKKADHYLECFDSQPWTAMFEFIRSVTASNLQVIFDNQRNILELIATVKENSSKCLEVYTRDNTKQDEMNKKIQKIELVEKKMRESKKELFSLISRLEVVEGKVDSLLQALKMGKKDDGPIIPLEQLFK